MRGVIALVLVAMALWAAAPAGAVHVSCGQTITTDTVLDSDLTCDTSTALTVGADDVDIDLNGHTVQPVGDFPDRSKRGILVISRDRISVKNGVVRGFGTGIQIGGADGVVEGVSFQQNSQALNLNSSQGGRAEGNSFEQNDTGVQIHNEDVTKGQNIVRQNVIVGKSPDHSNGFDVFDTTGNLIEDNVVSGVELGINLLGEAAGTRIEGNTLEIAGEVDNCCGWGIAVFNDLVGNSTKIVGNTIEGGFVGVWMSESATGSRIVENTIERSGYGILWELTAPDMRIEGNVIDEPRYGGIFVDWQGILLGPQHSTTIARNRVTGSGGDGVFVEENPGDVIVEDNLVSGSGDDGIESRVDPFPAGDDPTPIKRAIIRGNSAWENGDWGIVAESSSSDGGGNRAWSNGQAAQCLNIVCGPGPPASLSLSPQSATNTVGDRHCVTATVKDSDGRPLSGESVRFSVNSGGAVGAVSTDAGGTAEFCYDGPIAPRTDSISAYADDDGDGVQDPGEPSGSATKSWVVPAASGSCRVKGSGTLVASNGDPATFRLDVRGRGSGLPRGSLSYEDEGPADPFVVRSPRVTSMVCAGSSVSIFGRTHSSSGLTFRIDVVDRDAAGDGYRIRVSNGYDSGDQVVTSGNIRVR